MVVLVAVALEVVTVEVIVFPALVGSVGRPVAAPVVSTAAPLTTAVAVVLVFVG